MLPWKREDDYESGHPIKQHEFPAWCSNKEYLAYSSPSATFLGKERRRQVIGSISSYPSFFSRKNTPLYS